MSGSADSNRTDDVIGLRLNVPIFSGGGTQSRVREQVYLHRAAREKLEGTMRAAERETRDAYLGVIAEKARVQALQQAVKSNQTALEATEAGFEVGTRTTVDVLDARRRLFEAQRDYARSRYDYLINIVRLKSATGGLAPDDLDAINGFLTQPTTAAGASVADASRLSSGAIIATSRSTAPRLCATTSRPRAPVGARARRVVEPVGDALRQFLAAAHDAQRAACSSRSAMSCAFCVCGPESIGSPSTAGSSRLCPPIGTRLPPTNATSAAA